MSGVNQIACIDADASGTCNASETLWEYDRFGNLLTDGSTQYTYDAANRLSSITTASGTTTYGYNGDGDRVSQSVNGTLTTYVLDTATPLTMVLAETTSAETVRYWHALDTLAQSDGTTTEYFAYDGLGSVRQLVGESGSVGLAQTFDPYGNGYARAGSSASSLGYTGEQTDSNGFVYLRARYYNPAFGRFFQRDAWSGDFEQPLTRNPYLYSLGNPVMFTDPSGHCVFAGVDTMACAILLGAVTGGLIGATFAGIYASWIYTLVENGDCGCVEEEQVLAFTRAQFVARAVLVGAAFGAIFGGISAIGAGPAFVVSLAGMGLSGTAVYVNAQRVIDDPNNKCAWLDLGVSLVGLTASAYSALRAYQAGSTSGAWINRYPKDLLMPGGKPIGAPGNKGKDPSIREVQGNLDAATKFFNKLVQATKAKPTSNTSYPGNGYDVDGGSFIGLRTVHSKSPSTAATIDVQLPGIPFDKIKFNP